MVALARRRQGGPNRLAHRLPRRARRGPGLPPRRPARPHALLHRPPRRHHRVRDRLARAVQGVGHLFDGLGSGLVDRVRGGVRGGRAHGRRGRALLSRGRRRRLTAAAPATKQAPQPRPRRAHSRAQAAQSPPRQVGRPIDEGRGGGGRGGLRGSGGRGLVRVRPGQQAAPPAPGRTRLGARPRGRSGGRDAGLRQEAVPAAGGGGEGRRVRAGGARHSRPLLLACRRPVRPVPLQHLIQQVGDGAGVQGWVVQRRDRGGGGLQGVRRRGRRLLGRSTNLRGGFGRPLGRGPCRADEGLSLLLLLCILGRRRRQFPAPGRGGVGRRTHALVDFLGRAAPAPPGPKPPVICGRPARRQPRRRQPPDGRVTARGGRRRWRRGGRRAPPAGRGGDKGRGRRRRAGRWPPDAGGDLARRRRRLGRRRPRRPARRAGHEGPARQLGGSDAGPRRRTRRRRRRRLGARLPPVQHGLGRGAGGRPLGHGRLGGGRGGGERRLLPQRLLGLALGRRGGRGGRGRGAL